MAKDNPFRVVTDTDPRLESSKAIIKQILTDMLAKVDEEDVETICFVAVTNECAVWLIPADAVIRLREHADGIRNGSSRAGPSGINASSVSAIATTCRLTYAQAVYWIDPLLTAIDQANSQLAGIRDIEKTRVSQ